MQLYCCSQVCHWCSTHNHITFTVKRTFVRNICGIPFWIALLADLPLSELYILLYSVSFQRACSDHRFDLTDGVSHFAV